MIYKINNNENRIRIFGKTFVENNKNKCRIIYNNIIFSLQEYLYFSEKFKKGDNLEIILIEFEYIYNRKCMFYECNLLKEFYLPDDTKKYYKLKIVKHNNDINSNLLNINDEDSFNHNIEYLDLYDCIDISYMFKGSSSLDSISDISRLNTSEINNSNILTDITNIELINNRLKNDEILKKKYRL